MGLAIHINAIDETVKNDTMVDLKNFNNQSLATQAKNRTAVSIYDACY